MKNNNVLRRVLALLFAAMASLALLVTVATSSSAAPAYPPAYPPPYPPTTCSSTSQGQGQSQDCGSDEKDRRGTGGDTEKRTADTGLAPITASIIAFALLAGGAGLVYAGRRRRHS